jgi:hypothetical protein
MASEAKGRGDYDKTYISRKRKESKSRQEMENRKVTAGEEGKGIGMGREIRETREEEKIGRAYCSVVENVHIHVRKAERGHVRCE